MMPVIKIPDSISPEEARQVVDRAAKALEARELGARLREGRPKSYRQVVGRL